MTRVAPGAEQRRARVCGTPPFHVEPTAVTGRKAACLRRSRGGEWSPWAPCGDARGRVGRGRADQDGAAPVRQVVSVRPARPSMARRPVHQAETQRVTDGESTGGVGRRAMSGAGIAHPGVRAPRRSWVLAGARRVSRRGLRERRAGLCRPCGGPRCDVFHVKRSRGSRYRVRRTVRSSGAPIERPSGRYSAAPIARHDDRSGSGSGLGPGSGSCRSSGSGTDTGAGVGTGAGSPDWPSAVRPTDDRRVADWRVADWRLADWRLADWRLAGW